MEEVTYPSTLEGRTLGFSLGNLGATTALKEKPHVEHGVMMRVGDFIPTQTSLQYNSTATA